VVEGWQLDPSGPYPPIALSHGSYDAVIPVEFAHRSLAQLEAAGAEVLYRESPIEHAIDPEFVAELRPWLRAAVTTTGGG
jgi:phospholipase/carboxylesterase